MNKKTKIPFLIAFSIVITAFIVFAILNANLENKELVLCRDVSLAATLTVSFSFSITITIEFKNYYSKNHYENCSFGNSDNNEYSIKKQCNEIKMTMLEYIEKYENKKQHDKESICIKYFPSIYSKYTNIKASIDSIEDKTNLANEVVFIQKIGLISSTLKKEKNEIATLCLFSNKKISEINREMKSFCEEYKKE